VCPLGWNNTDDICVYISSPTTTLETPLNFIHKTDAKGSDVWGKGTMTGSSS